MMTPLLVAAATLITKQWTLPNSAKSFAATIGQQCLSTEGATIDATGAVLTVTETPDCAAEIEEIAKNWAIFAPTDAIVTVTGAPSGLAAKRIQLEGKFGKSPNPRLRFLAETQTCRCLVMAGKLSLEASQLVQGEEKTAEKTSPRSFGFDDPLDTRKDRSLIWRSGPSDTPLSNDRPLVN